MSALDLVEPPNLSRQRFTSTGKSKSDRGSRKSRRYEAEANEKHLNTSPIRGSKKVETRKLKSGERKKNHLSQGIKTSAQWARPKRAGKLPQQGAKADLRNRSKNGQSIDIFDDDDNNKVESPVGDEDEDLTDGEADLDADNIETVNMEKEKNNALLSLEVPKRQSRKSDMTARSCHVATLNLLGDIYNPFEFLPLADQEFMRRYQVIEDCARSLVWEDIEEYVVHIISLEAEYDIMGIEYAIRNLRKHCETMEAEVSGLPQDGTVWSFFQSQILHNDNKIIEKRINMLTMANSSLDLLPSDLQELWRNRNDEPTQQWHLNSDDNGTWLKPFCGLLKYESYRHDPNLFVWDLVCNVIANMCTEQHNSIASASLFSADNVKNYAERLISKVCDNSTQMTDMPVVLGIQEWPAEGSLRAQAIEAELSYRDMKVVPGKTLGMGAKSVAVAYSSILGTCRPLTTTGDLSPESASSTKLLRPTDVMKSVLEEFRDSLSEDEMNKMVKTTAAKTMGIRLGENLTVLVVHAKGPTSPAAASCLARFILTMAEKLPSPWVAMSDTNMSSDGMYMAFELEVTSGGSSGSVQNSSSLVPVGGTDTTSKHRSSLHGQCYDENKCLKTVKASKDRLLCGGDVSVRLDNVDIFPDIESRINSPTNSSGGKIIPYTLPNNHWPSDHCMVSADLIISGTDGDEDSIVWSEAMLASAERTEAEDNTEQAAPLSPAALRRHQKNSAVAGESFYGHFMTRGIGPTRHRRPSSTTATAGGGSERGSERGSEKGQSEKAESVQLFHGSPERDSVDDLIQGTLMERNDIHSSPTVESPTNNAIGLAEIMAEQAKIIVPQILAMFSAAQIEAKGGEHRQLDVQGENLIYPIPQALSPKARIPSFSFSNESSSICDENEQMTLGDAFDLREGWSYEFDICVDTAANVLHEIWRDSWNSEYPYNAAYSQISHVIDPKLSTRPHLNDLSRPIAQAPDWTAAFDDREDFLDWFDDESKKAHIVRDRITGTLPSANTKTAHIEVDKNNAFTLLPNSLRKPLIERVGTFLLGMMGNKNPMRLFDVATAAHDQWKANNPGAVEWAPNLFEPFDDLNVEDKLQYYYLVQSCALSYAAVQRAKDQIDIKYIAVTGDEKSDERIRRSRVFRDAGLTVIGVKNDVLTEESCVSSKILPASDNLEENIDNVTFDGETLDHAFGEGSTLEGDTLDDESFIDEFCDPDQNIDTGASDLEDSIDVATPKASHLSRGSKDIANENGSENESNSIRSSDSPLGERLSLPKSTHIFLNAAETAYLEREALWRVHGDRNARCLREAGLGDLNDPRLLILSVGRWAVHAYDSNKLVESFPIGTDVFSEKTLSEFKYKLFDSKEAAATPTATHSSPTKTFSSFSVEAIQNMEEESKGGYNRVVIIGSIGEFCLPEDPLVVPLQEIASRLHHATQVEDSPYGIVCAKALKIVDGLLCVLSEVVNNITHGKRDGCMSTFEYPNLSIVTINNNQQVTSCPYLINKAGDTLANGGLSLMLPLAYANRPPGGLLRQYEKDSKREYEYDVFIDWNGDSYTIHDLNAAQSGDQAVKACFKLNANDLICVPDSLGKYSVDNCQLKRFLQILKDKVIQIMPNAVHILIVQTNFACDLSGATSNLVSNITKTQFQYLKHPHKKDKLPKDSQLRRSGPSSPVAVIKNSDTYSTLPSPPTPGSPIERVRRPSSSTPPQSLTPQPKKSPSRRNTGAIGQDSTHLRHESVSLMKQLSLMQSQTKSLLQGSNFGVHSTSHEGRRTPIFILYQRPSLD